MTSFAIPVHRDAVGQGSGRRRQGKPIVRAKRTLRVGRRSVELSSLDKVLFPTPV